jgi:hypothetical protein
VRYPKALERIGSPLYHAKRNHNALTPPEQDFLAKVTSPIAIAALVYDADWRDFGGYPQEAPIGGYGQFESAHHNPMHNDYFGGDMEDQSRAALDPGFFSFHAYIDLLFQLWLDQHGPQSVTSQSHFLRATQPATVTPAPGHTNGAGLPSMGQAGIYLDPARLGCGYEVTDEDRLPNLRALAAVLYHVNGVLPPFGTTEKSRHALLSGDGLFDPRRGPATAIANVAVRIPAGVIDVYAAFARPHDAPDVNFNVDFYLHPSDSAFDLAQKTERERYIVASFGHFGSGTMADPGAHGADKPLYADLTPTLKDLAATGHAGESWTLTAVVSGPAPQPTFGSLSLLP